jgi:hypothetical protein
MGGKNLKYVQKRSAEGGPPIRTLPNKVFVEFKQSKYKSVLKNNEQLLEVL